MYAQKLLLNDDTNKQGTGTSEANKLRLQMVQVILVCMCIRTDIWLIELWSCNFSSVVSVGCVSTKCCNRRFTICLSKELLRIGSKWVFDQNIWAMLTRFSRKIGLEPNIRVFSPFTQSPKYFSQVVLQEKWAGEEKRVWSACERNEHGPLFFQHQEEWDQQPMWSTKE